MLSSQVMFLVEGIHGIGFLNAIVLMPFAVIFSVAAAKCLFQQRESSAVRWFAASLIVIGLNYVIYLIYSFIANTLNSLPLVDIWVIPLLGLGVALILQVRYQDRS